MKKYLIVFVCLLLAAVAASAGCVTEEQTPEQKITGEWYNPQALDLDGALVTIHYTFEENKTGKVDMISNGIAVKTIKFNWGYVDEGEGKAYYMVGYLGLPRGANGMPQSSFLSIVNQDNTDYLCIFDGFSEGLTMIKTK